jgi:ABC-type cobalamin transport system ATPase subunit
MGGATGCSQAGSGRLIALASPRIQGVGDVTGPILVVIGPSGVGKTIISTLVAGAFSFSVHLRADDLTYAIVNGFVAP